MRFGISMIALLCVSMSVADANQFRRPAVAVRPASTPQFVRPAPPRVETQAPKPAFVRPSTPTPRVNTPGAGAPAVNRPTTGFVRPPAAATPVSSAKTIIPPTPPAKQSEVDRNMARGQSATALASYQKDQSRFKAPPVGTPTTRQAATASPVWRQYGSQWHNSDDYYHARTTYINRLPPQRAAYWNSPPIYVVNARPAYGSFSGAFLGSLIGTALVNGSSYTIDDSYGRWAYAHRQSVEYQQWHADMMAQAENDAEVRARMAALDAQVQQDVQANVTVDENALPNDVDPSLVVAPDTVLMATSTDDPGPASGGDNSSWDN